MGVIYDSASTSNAKATSILSHDGWWFPRSKDLVAIQYKCFHGKWSKQATVVWFSSNSGDWLGKLPKVDWWRLAWKISELNYQTKKKNPNHNFSCWLS